MLYKFLLILHIAGGAIALITSIIAMASKKGSELHRRVGRYFFYGMSDIFLTAIPMTWIQPNLFLFIIALFSYYFAYTGWRYSKIKLNTPHYSDLIVAYLMMFIACVMVGVGIYQLKSQNFESIVLLVFGVLSAIVAFTDIKTMRKGKLSTKIRISKHVGAMIGATISAVTAFATINIKIQPDIIVWLAPTVIFVPFIFYWNKRIFHDKKPISPHAIDL